ncbi:MAG: tetratricopeptide repeat protein [Candidatus Binataceae bacterium]|jgi:tetratricopeptide (TPR) repeat protein
MISIKGFGNWFGLIVSLTIMMGFGSAPIALAATAEADQVCDPAADYFLGAEDYPEAARLHRILVKQHPGDALAHYHLGFAEGMMGDQADETDQYQTAVRLGLKDWGLYLNLGRVYLEKGEFAPATEAFKQAVTLGPNHPEAHFNLGLAYERRGMLASAASELTQSLALDPSQTDGRNMLAVVNAEQGNYPEAQAIWSGLVRSQPSFTTARVNLAILDETLKKHGSGALALTPGSLESAFASKPQ